MRKALFLGCLVTMIIGCKKQQVPAAWSKQVIVPCSEANVWTIESVGKALRGNWLLYRLEAANGQQTVPYRKISFFDGGNLIISNIAGEMGGNKHANYSIEKNGSNFLIHTDDSLASTILAGNLYVCDPYMVCSNSIDGGLDQFYQRD